MTPTSVPPPTPGAATPEPAPAPAPAAAYGSDELTDEARESQRAEQASVRARPDRRSKGLIIVNTGPGKGKTTAALGVAMRAWGRGMNVIVLQFLKAQTGNWGERRAAKRMGIEMVGLGDGFTWMSKDLEQDRALAQSGWARCREAILTGNYDVVVLDELTYCFKYGWLDIAEVLDVLSRRPSRQHVIITGRDAPAALVEAADLVSEIAAVKHPYQDGIRAQKGIEF